VNGDRTTRIWTAISLRAQQDGAALSPAQACLACVDAVGVTGGSLLVASALDTMEPLFTTDRRAHELEELQTTLGEGPGVDALGSGTPVTISDLTSGVSVRRWPGFARDVGRLGVRAMFSLPLALGAIRVGVLDLYRDTPGELNAEQLMDALVYADTALLLVLDVRSGIETAAEADRIDGGGPALWHAEVHQAAGMVSVQLGIPVLDALVRLRAHAYGQDLRLTEVARSIVERRLRFRPGDLDPVVVTKREGTS
jgi:hypothetical protein